MKKSLIVIVICLSVFVCFAGAKTNYGDAIVTQVISVYDGDTFRCNIEGYPPIIGENMSIRVKGIDTPELKDKHKDVKELAYKAKDFTAMKLRAAKSIKLKNMERGKYFRIVADVEIEGENLGELLINEGLAKPYDGGSKPKRGELSRKPVDEIKVISKPMFGIYLGEKLSDVKNRFETTKYPLNKWAVRHTSGAVEDCHINTYKDRVWCITTWLKDNTKRNFNILKQQLKKEYRKYQVREVKSSRSKRVNPRLPMTYDLQFKVIIDGIPIIVALTFTDNSTSDISVPNELSIQFIHLPLMEKVTTEKQ